MKLELKNVTKEFTGKTVLNGIDAVLTNGVYGLLGPNGAGKSTLIRAICNLDSPTQGAVFYDGEHIDKLGAQYREILGYVPQKIGYYPDFTAVEFLKYMSILKGIPKRYQEERIREVLELVNLTDTGNKKMKHFSGGMKQRIGIAQAILNHPEILILDEPTVGLDLEERMKFKQFISEYSADRIIIFATHIVSDIEDIGNEILILKDGKIKVQASQERLLATLTGAVWECECGKKEAAELKKKYKVSNTRVNGEKIIVRVISKEKPGENAVPAEGSLQDLYLFLFNREA